MIFNASAFWDGTIWHFDPMTHSIVKFIVEIFALFVVIRAVDSLDRGYFFGRKLSICPRCNRQKSAFHGMVCKKRGLMV